MYVNGRLKLFRHLFHSAVQQTLRPVVLQIQKLFKNMTPTQQFFQLVGSRRRYLKYVTNLKEHLFNVQKSGIVSTLRACF